jgi:hypothetical protein
MRWSAVAACFLLVVAAVGCGSRAAVRGADDDAPAASPAATLSNAATATSAATYPNTPPPAATIGSDEDGCDSFDAYDDEPVSGVPFDSVDEQVRAMLDGLRPSDEVQAPTTRDAPGATWRVVRSGGVVAEVEFVRSGGAWIPSRGAACVRVGRDDAVS